MIRFCLFLGSLLCLHACAPTDPSVAAPVTLVREGLTLTVDPRLGGRITSLTLNGREVLQTTRDSLNLQWGSTVWTSPQSAWRWPPIATFDSEPYTLTELRENVLLLESARDSATNLRMRKRISLGPDADVGLTYWVTNEGASSVSVGLWENTRLPYAGRIAFVADSIRFQRDSTPVVLRDSTAVIYFDDRHSAPEKVFADLRTDSVTYINDGLALTKYTAVRYFEHVAPGQAPLEIYFDAANGFMEFELQGVYRLLDPGESNNLRVRWRLSEVAE